MNALLRLLSVLLFAPLAAGGADRPNVLFIAVDDLNHWVGHLQRNKQTKTPNLDRLAAGGTRFASAYTNCPICVPARASFATGRYVHQIRFWDNAIAYDGSVPSWAHRLKAAWHRVDSIGKLHYRSPDEDHDRPDVHRGSVLWPRAIDTHHAECECRRGPHRAAGKGDAGDGIFDRTA